MKKARLQYTSKEMTFCIGSFVSIIFVMGLTVGNSDIGGAVLENRILDFNYLNFIPFIGMIGVFLSAVGGDIKNMINLGGNIVLFIPVGFFFGAFFLNVQKSKKIIILLGIISSSVIEIFQIAGRRNFDINDILLNTMGTYIGFWFLRLCKAYNYKIIDHLSLGIEYPKNKTTFLCVNLLSFFCLFCFCIYKWIKAAFF